MTAIHFLYGISNRPLGMGDTMMNCWKKGPLCVFVISSDPPAAAERKCEICKKSKK